MEKSKWFAGLTGNSTNEGITTEGHQSLFLLHLIEIIPEMTDEIENMYKQFERICKSLEKEKNTMLLFYEIEEINTINQFAEEVIEGWAKKWFIQEKWVVDTIMQTFTMWYEDEETKQGLIFSDSSISRIMAKIYRVHEEVLANPPMYNPFIHDKIQYKRMIDHLVTEYVRKIEGVMKESEFSTAKENRTLYRYQWLVYYHVLGYSYQDILEEYFMKGNVGRIRKEIRNLYKDVGLNRRNRKKEGSNSFIT